jgi:hypothetical protein
LGGTRTTTRSAPRSTGSDNAWTRPYWRCANCGPKNLRSRDTILWGPRRSRSGGVPLVAGVVGPKALARAAQWADGVSDPAHSLHLDAEGLAAQRERVAQAWQAAAGPKSRTLNRGASGLLGAINSAPRRGPDGRRGTALPQHQLSQRPAGVLIATSRTGRGDRAGDRFEPSRRRSRTSRSPSECQGMRELRPEQRADLGQG